MRILFFILLLANLVFFAYGQGYFDSPAQHNPDTSRVQQQLNPEKIRLLTEQQVANLPLAQPKRNEAAKGTACFEWGIFLGSDLARAQGAITALHAGIKTTERKLQEPPEYWIYMPPQGSRKNAEKKGQELKQLGVSNFQVVQDAGPWQFALSLGVFSSEAAANVGLAKLKKKGVRSARLGERSIEAKTILQLREAPNSLQDKISQLIKQDFPGTEVKECKPEEKKT